MPALLRPRPVTLREKAAQLVFARLGSNMEPPVRAEDDAARVATLLERCPLGGLILFNGRLPETPKTLAALQRRSRYPLLVATDMERGLGQQIEGATVFPHAMAFGALGNAAEENTEAAARAAAREALACGLHITFAPVADVHLYARNPIISTRAFSAEPDVAARLTAAYVRGARAEGLLTTAKHFPGHGRTTGDTHAERPIVETPREELERTDLVPFRAAIEAGAELVMTAHAAYPALDASGQAATLSRPILHDLLRGEMGFGGAVVSDSLLMGAVRTADAGAQAVALLNAGVDLLLDPHDPEAVVEGLVRGVEEGAIKETRLDEAFGRVWALKEALHRRHGARAFAETPGGLDEVGSEAHRRLAQEIAEAAVTVLHVEAGTLPLNPSEADEGRLLVMRVTSRQAANEAPLGQAVRAVFPKAAYREVGPQADEARLAALHKEALQAAQVVLALVVEPAAWHAFGLKPTQQRFVRRLVEARPVILAALGSSHVLEDLPSGAAALCTYSDVEPAQHAFIRALAGALPEVTST